jgi:GrpB-like predicted nucleotidyltransferase (UPF0157 family)
MKRNNWPIWANETVELIPFDSKWFHIGLELMNELDMLKTICPLIQIEHIGSTSVMGLMAKPIIDIMAMVETFDNIELMASLLLKKEWHFVPAELDKRPYRRFFVKVKNNTRIAHLHLMLPNTKKWDEQLLFRDKLRESECLVSEYAALKLSLVNTYGNDREAYTNAKTKFINRVLSS